MNRACLAGCKDFVFHSETRSSTKIVSQSGLMFHKFILVTLWRIYCEECGSKRGVLKETLVVISVSGDGACARVVAGELVVEVTLWVCFEGRAQRIC